MAKIRIRLDFKKFFDREAVKIIASYKRLMTVGRGVENDTAPKHKASKNKKKWMIDTGELRDQGFIFRASRNRLLIFPSGKRHARTNRTSKAPSYKQLFRWHNQGRSSALGQTYSGIFNQLPLKSAFPDRFKKEAIRQLKPQIVKALREEFKRA